MTWHDTKSITDEMRELEQLKVALRAKGIALRQPRGSRRYYSLDYLSPSEHGSTVKRWYLGTTWRQAKQHIEYAVNVITDETAA